MKHRPECKKTGKKVSMKKRNRGDRFPIWKCPKCGHIQVGG